MYRFANLRPLNSRALLFPEKSDISALSRVRLACRRKCATSFNNSATGEMIMYPNITIGIATALVLASSLALGALTAATPSLARAHRHHHAAPAKAHAAATADYARYRGSDYVPFAPF